MAEQEKPTEGRRRREPGPAGSLHRPGEGLLWLLTGGGILLGWAPEAEPSRWAAPESGWIGLRLPVMLHQVPAGDGAGGVGMVQLYACLQVDELLVDRVNIIAHTWLAPESDLAQVHADAWRQRGGRDRVIALPPGSKLAH